MKTLQLIFLSTLLFAAQIASPQKKKGQTITMEEIAQQCENVPVAQRVTMSVSSFNVATPTAYAKFGDELSQMLTNALQNVQCFNVLLSTKDSNEILDEISFGETGNTAAGATPKRGKMKGAQVIVMGKVTEFADGQSTTSFGPIKVGGNKAHLGFIIQLINTETRELIDSKSFNVDGRSNGFKGVRLFGVQTAGSTQNNKALADACEQGIIQAVEYITSTRDKLPLPDANSVSAKGGTYFTVKNVDYGKMKVLTDVLATKGSISEKNISQGIGTFFLENNMETDALADFINTKLGKAFSIESLESNTLTLAAK